MEKIVTNYVELIEVPIDKEYVERLIQFHPEFPSLLSVSDVFNRFGIEHVVARDSILLEQFPYLLSLDNDMGGLYLIKDKKELNKIFPEVKNYGAIILKASKTKKIKDPKGRKINSYTKKIKLSLSIWLILLLPIFSFLLYSKSSYLIGYFILSIIGVLTGYFIFAKEIGVSYKAVDELCNSSNRLNCDKVLNSNISFFGISLGDIAISYFVSTSIILIIGGLSQETQVITETFQILSFLTIPVILFSIYYQYFISKTWCRLCLIIVTILSMQLMLGLILFGIINELEVLLNPFVYLFVPSVFLSTIFFLSFFKNLILRVNELNGIGFGDSRIKHNRKIFKNIIEGQNYIARNVLSAELIVGNKEAPIQIIMAANTHCDPCMKKHEEISELIEMYPDDFSVTFRFVRSGYDDANGTETLYHLLKYWNDNIRGTNEEEKHTMKFLNDWYVVRDLAKFSKNYPLTDDSIDKFIKQCEKEHYEWNEAVNIILTPTLFINGYRLPIEYNISDLIAMMPDLIELPMAPDKNKEIRMKTLPSIN